MQNPTEKTAATRALTMVPGHYELYSSRATLGLICRPVKRIPKKDNNDVKKLVDTAIDTQKQATPPPTPPANGAQGAGSTPESASVAVDNPTQKAAEDAIGKVLGGFRARLLVQDEIENKTSDSEDEYGPLIKMPLPEKIKDSLRVNYSTVELGFAAAGYLFGENVAKPFAEGAGIADTLVGNASYVIRTLLSSIPSIGALAQKSAGNIPNPFTAAIFEKVTPRKFNFSWTIQPQTAEESKNLRDIINQFRYWSLPNPSSDALILDVPYEWELSFVGTDFLYAFSRCVMANLDIDYSPNGFNAFMIDGAPQSVTITIDFEEIYPLDKANMDAKGVPESMKIEAGKGTTRAENRALENLAREEAAIKQRAQIAASATKESELAGELSKALETSEFRNNNKIGTTGPDGIVVTDASRIDADQKYNSALSNLENQQNQTQIERTKLAEITGEAVQAPATPPGG
jgi:hypothetical protein